MKKTTMIRSLLVAFLTFTALVACAPSFAQIGVGVVVNVEPPELPVYDQPVCPGDDYIWTPGYWAWDPDVNDYYWVPGTWVEAPEPGFFWTPGYWGWQDTGYVFTAGYWGPVIGFYGGVDYGFGYFGTGFVGGRWDNGHFFYNTAVWNVNTTVIHNTYVDRTVIRETTVNRVSYNGGRGGITARPTPQEEAAARERHVGPVEAQTRNINAARSNPEFRASQNHGRPTVAATARPGEFKGSGVVAAKEGGTVHTGEARPGNTSRPAETRPEENGARPNAVHPNELPPAEHMTAPNTGNAKLDQKYQQQQRKLATQQAKERQSLQQRQDQEHAKAAKQNANEAQKQQMEQRHTQQTQQLQQKHQQQQQQLQQRQQAPAHPTSHPAPGHPQQ